MKHLRKFLVVLLVCLAMMGTIIPAAAQDDVTVEPTADVVTEVAPTDEAGEIPTLEIELTPVIDPGEEPTDPPPDDNTKEIVALAKDLGMWAVFLVMLWLMRNSISPDVYRELLQERRERAAQTPGSFDDLAVEVAERVLNRIMPAQNVRASPFPPLDPPKPDARPDDLHG